MERTKYSSKFEAFPLRVIASDVKPNRLRNVPLLPKETQKLIKNMITHIGRPRDKHVVIGQYGRIPYITFIGFWRVCDGEDRFFIEKYFIEENLPAELLKDIKDEGINIKKIPKRFAVSEEEPRSFLDKLFRKRKNPFYVRRTDYNRKESILQKNDFFVEDVLNYLER